jgi:hypothetical protein
MRAADGFGDLFTTQLQRHMRMYTFQHKLGLHDAAQGRRKFCVVERESNCTKIERRKYCGALSLCLSLSRTMSEKTNHFDILRALSDGKHLIGSITRFYCSLDLS